MTRGGHANSGPPRDPNALRRDRPGDQAQWTHLPAVGRPGDPPEWPLPTATARERSLWAAEWRRPQALMWEARGQHLEVALYVRAVVVAEGRKAKSADRLVVVRCMEELGVSGGGLRRNLWVIDSDPGDQHEAARPAEPDGRSAKERLNLVVNNG